jgi:hypothetical protein
MEYDIKDQGFAVVFRRSQNPVSTFKVKFNGLHPDKSYVINFDNMNLILTGKALLEGIEINLPNYQSSKVIIIKRGSKCKVMEKEMYGFVRKDNV